MCAAPRYLRKAKRERPVASAGWRLAVERSTAALTYVRLTAPRTVRFDHETPEPRCWPVCGSLPSEFTVRCGGRWPGPALPPVYPPKTHANG